MYSGYDVRLILVKLERLFLVEYDFTCDCDAEKFPLIEKAVGGVNSYKNNMFKALLCSKCLKDHEEAIALDC